MAITFITCIRHFQITIQKRLVSAYSAICKPFLMQVSLMNAAVLMLDMRTSPSFSKTRTPCPALWNTS